MNALQSHYLRLRCAAPSTWFDVFLAQLRRAHGKRS
jgi:hypothetical protein